MSADTNSAPMIQRFAAYLPILEWLPGYERAWLRTDAIAAVQDFPQAPADDTKEELEPQHSPR